MSVPRSPAHALAAALCLGLALANVGRIHGIGLVSTVVAAVAVVAAHSPPVRVVALALFLCSLGWWWSSARLDALDRSALVAEIGRSGRAVVEVTTTPTKGSFSLRARGRARRFDGVPVDEPVELELPSGRSPPQGAILDALAVVEAPAGPEDGFDERTRLRRQGVHVVLHLDEWRQIAARGGLGGIADRLRRWLARSIAPGLSGERRSVLEGIVLGEGSSLSPRLRDDFRASGLYHLLAVSGQNVVLVAAGALVLAWLLGLARWIGEVGALAGIMAYVLAVGPQPSVIRAGVAGSLASLAWLSGRLRDAWYALLLAATGLLAWNPYLVYDPGFQLSFAAVAAIFTVVPAIDRRLAGGPLPRGLRLGVAVSAGCGLVTAPILWLQFGYLPLLGVPANALAEPAMPVLLGLAFVTAGLALALPSAAAVVASLNGWVALYIALCAHVIGSLPFAEIKSTRALAGLTAAILLVAAGRRIVRARPARAP